MTTEGIRLWHSAISPLMNIGLLTPQYVLDEAISYAENNDVPLNSLEGFIRQILGWREFIRASYECGGGSFATKPYISGSNYLKKMSDYKKGDWEDTWTALYWNFIAQHRPVFEKNHRLSMMPRMLDKMDSEKRTQHGVRAKTYLNSLS